MQAPEAQAASRCPSAGSRRIESSMTRNLRQEEKKKSQPFISFQPLRRSLSVNQKRKKKKKKKKKRNKIKTDEESDPQQGATGKEYRARPRCSERSCSRALRSAGIGPVAVTGPDGRDGSRSWTPRAGRRTDGTDTRFTVRGSSLQVVQLVAISSAPCVGVDPHPPFLDPCCPGERRQ
ncbi:hypothetical protein VTN02DRAFT_932 [Thermoascus thermophilus]